MPSRNQEAHVHTRAAGFTVVNNGILRDRHLSLKAKGLLCTVLSLPPDWDYSIPGLVAIVNPPDTEGGVDRRHGQSDQAIGAILSELERRGYLVRVRERDEGGKLGRTAYHFYDTPQPPVGPEGESGMPEAACAPEPEPVRRNASGAGPAPARTQAPEQEKRAESVRIPRSEPKRDFPRVANPAQLNKESNQATPLTPLPAEQAAPLAGDGARRRAGDGEDGIPEEIAELVRESIKPVRASALPKILRAYERRLAQGYTRRQILDAYRAYARRYRATHDDERYAKRLEAWLDGADGLRREAPAPARRRDADRPTLEERACAEDSGLAAARSALSAAYSALARGVARGMLSPAEQERRRAEIEAMSQDVNSRLAAWAAAHGAAAAL